MLELTAATSMQGEISLLIDRQPDFFTLLEKRGETKVFVAEDQDRIIGSLSVSCQSVYVDKKVLPVLYIGDFKVYESYRNKGIGLKLCDEMAAYVISAGSDLAFLNVAKGNKKPLSFFRNRPHIPDFDTIGNFHIHQFIGRRNKPFSAGHLIKKSAADQSVIHFLNDHYCQYELGNVITRESIDQSDIFIVEDQEAIRGVICLTDTMHYKQNIVMKLSSKLKILLKLLNSFRNILGISRMPLQGEPVKMMYVKYLAVTHHDKKIVRLLIDHARNIIYDKGYSFISIGVHEKDPLNACFSGIFKLTFQSVGMLLSIRGNQQLVEKVKKGVPFEDYSLV
ncbi:MAG TPA: GNAT family N-acetyltransferase [Bacteroidia bacterium]|nr:GNAT family N-acetyltransferase [Bacteroidia bacterium]